MDIQALPKVIQGKGVTILIDAPILSDAGEIEAACREALQRTAEAIVADVVEFRRDDFADKPGHNTAKEYGSLEAYYSSGMIPYWRGGLVGSFTDAGEDSWGARNLTFTAPYAATIENGGGTNSDIPEDWWWDKTDATNGVVYSTHSHPFVGSVAYKIESNLENFGYLDIFASTFKAHFSRWV